MIIRKSANAFFVFILVLSLLPLYSADKTAVKTEDKIVKTAGSSDKKIDIRDKTPDNNAVRDKEKTAKAGKSADSKKKEKSGKKDKSKKTAKKNNAKTGKTPVEKKKTGEKKEKKTGRNAEVKADDLIYSNLRDHVLNNRILDVKKIMVNPEERKKYDLNRLIVLNDGKKTTLLCDAVSMNYQDMADLLISGGADINMDLPGTGTPLHIAASVNNLEMIKFLLLKGAGIDIRDSEGNTPLMLALHNGSFDSAYYLVMKGANAVAVNNSGSTTIHEAVTGGNHECVRLMLAQNRGDINRGNRAGETPLYLAMKRNDAVLMRLLRDYGAVDPRVTVTEPSIGELIEGTYTVKEYGRKEPGYRSSADDTTTGYRYVLRRDGTGTVDMNDPSMKDMPLRWRSEGGILIIEELDLSGYVTKGLRFPYLMTGGTVTFEKSDVQYGDVWGTRWEISRSQ